MFLRSPYSNHSTLQIRNILSNITRRSRHGRNSNRYNKQVRRRRQVNLRINLHTKSIAPPTRHNNQRTSTRRTRHNFNRSMKNRQNNNSSSSQNRKIQRSIARRISNEHKTRNHKDNIRFRILQFRRNTSNSATCTSPTRRHGRRRSLPCKLKNLRRLGRRSNTRRRKRHRRSINSATRRHIGPTTRRTNSNTSRNASSRSRRHKRRTSKRQNANTMSRTNMRVTTLRIRTRKITNNKKTRKITRVTDIQILLNRRTQYSNRRSSRRSRRPKSSRRQITTRNSPYINPRTNNQDEFISKVSILRQNLLS